MPNKAYSEKLLDPRWQKKRLKILERDNWRCFYCGSNENTLHVHHLKYFGDPWDASDDYLITVCSECHECEHLYREESENELLDILKRQGSPYYRIKILSQAIKHGGNIGYYADDLVELALFVINDKELLDFVSKRKEERLKK